MDIAQLHTTKLRQKNPDFVGFMLKNSHRPLKLTAKQPWKSLVSSNTPCSRPDFSLVIITGENLTTPKQLTTLASPQSTDILINSITKTLSPHSTHGSIRHLKLGKYRLKNGDAVEKFLEGKRRIDKILKETNKLKRSETELGALIAKVSSLRKASKDSLRARRSQPQSLRSSMMTSVTPISRELSPVPNTKKTRVISKRTLSRQDIVFDGVPIESGRKITGAKLGMLLKYSASFTSRFK